MPTFTYESLTNSGQPRSGVLTAEDQADAVRQLMSRGETATSIVSQNGTSKKKQRPARLPGQKNNSGVTADQGENSRRPSLSRSDMANFMRELATALEAGLPLMQSLTTVRRQAKGKAMIAILDHLIERVEAGDPLYQAARAYGPPFDDMILGMLHAADASGEMSIVMHQLADLLDRSVELKREVMGATIYPMIIACLIAVSVVILITVIVPKLIEPMVAEMGSMPWPTEVVLGIATFLQHNWLYCLMGIAALWMGIRGWLSVPANRLRFDHKLLGIPVLGQLLRDIAVARFTRTLGTLTSSGLPLLEGLRITKNTLGNHALIEAINEVEHQVTGGKALADPLERSGLFPPLLVQVVNLGEKSGRLEHMLVHAAGAFDRKVNASLNLFTKVLPPLLVVTMAGIAGFVLAAIILPMINLSSMMS